MKAVAPLEVRCGSPTDRAGAALQLAGRKKMDVSLKTFIMTMWPKYTQVTDR